MAEIGSKEFPKPMSDEVVQAADAVITMGCGVRRLLAELTAPVGAAG
jgi:protein-tyrosine-phosphatase